MPRSSTGTVLTFLRNGAPTTEESEAPESEWEDPEKLITEPPPPPGPSNVALMKARLEWDSARKKVRTELERFEKAVLTATKNESDAQQIAEAASNVYDILEVLDTTLIDKLDEMINAEDPSQRFVLRKEAADIVKEYSAFVGTDPLVLNIDTNPFIPVKVRSTLEATLTGLQSKLS